MLNRPEEPLSGGCRVLTGARACAIVEFLIMKPSFICSIALLTVSLSSPLFAQTRFDLLLQGGHVIDAKNGISAIRDVGIKDGKIAAVAEHLDPSDAFKVVNVGGLYVTPGLIDIHVHVYASTGEHGS